MVEKLGFQKAVEIALLILMENAEKQRRQHIIKKIERRCYEQYDELRAGLVSDFLRSQNPLVSVIIPCHNYARYLAECIKSVLSQEYKPIEVIVVDDESSDNTAEVTACFPSVKYVRIKHNGKRTPANAMNIGISLSRGSYVLCLGADDFLHKDYVQRCLELLTSSLRLGFVWTAYQAFEAENYRSSPVKPHPLFGYYLGFGGQLGAMLMRRSLWRNIKYDSSLDGLEDFDLALTALERGWKCASINAPLHNYRKHPGTVNYRVHDNFTTKQLIAKHPFMRFARYIMRFWIYLTLLFKPRALKNRLQRRIKCAFC